MFVALAAVGLANACASIPLAPEAPLVTWAFTAPWDARSDSSVRAHRSALAAIVSGWIQLDSATGEPALPYRDAVPRIGSALRFALLTSYQHDRFHADLIRRLAADSVALRRTAASVAARLSGNTYDGLIIDFEGQSPADLAGLVHVVRTIADSARMQGVRTVGMAIPATDTAGYPLRAFAGAVDRFVVMLYDEHWSTSAPGPIASPDWARRALARRVVEARPSKIVAGFPLYTYQWRPGEPARALSFEDARRAAAEAGVEVARDPPSASLHAVKPGSWELWASDADLLRALVADAGALGVRTIALWRLGLEDPRVWDVVAQRE